MSLQGWNLLKCQASGCGGDEFVAAHNITWKEGQGTATKQTRWKCAKCGMFADTAKMIGVVQEEFLQKKIDELRAQQAGG